MSGRYRTAVLTSLLGLASILLIARCVRHGKADLAGPDVHPPARENFVLSPGGTLRTTQEPNPRSTRVDLGFRGREAVVGDGADAPDLVGIVSGRVEYPDDTPIDEEVVVVAGVDGEYRRSFNVDRRTGGEFKIRATGDADVLTLDVLAKYLWLRSPVQLPREDFQAPILLQPLLGGRVLVTALGEGGRPRSRVQVHAAEMDGPYRFEQYTDEAGECSFNAVPPGRYSIKCAKGRTADGSGTAFAIVPPGEETDVILGPPPQKEIVVFGRVLSDEEPVAGARILTGPSLSTKVSSGSLTRAGRDGYYSLTLDAFGPRVFEIRRDPSVPSFRAEHSIPDWSEFELDFHLPTGHISGRVRGPGGEPLPNVAVYIDHDLSQPWHVLTTGSAKVRTDESGAFVFTGLQASVYCLSAGCPSPFETLEVGSVGGWRVLGGVQLASGQHVANIDLNLPKPCTLVGSLIMPSTEDRAVGVWIYARVVKPDASAWSLIARTDRAGEFRSSGLPPGRLAILARAGNHASPLDQTVELTSGSVGGIEINMVPAARVMVTGQTATGHPVDLRVRVLDPSGIDLALGGPSKDCRYLQKVGPLPAGAYTLDGLGPGGLRGTCTVEVRQGSSKIWVTLEMK